MIVDMFVNYFISTHQRAVPQNNISANKLWAYAVSRTVGLNQLPFLVGEPPNSKGFVPPKCISHPLIKDSVYKTL